jgi:hypothetical protein
VGGTESAGHAAVRLEIDGGFAFFPGLSRPYVADTDELDSHDAATLRSLLAGADISARSGQEARRSDGAADRRTYTITALQDGTSHTVRMPDPIGDPAVQRLVDQLMAWGRRADDP